MTKICAVEDKTVVFFCDGPEKLPELISLASVESGNNDKKIGKHGEVSRYQILPETWQYFNIHYYSVVFWKSHHLAAQVAYMKFSVVMKCLVATLRRKPNAYELYMGWKTADLARFKEFPCKHKAFRYATLVLLEESKN